MVQQATAEPDKDENKKFYYHKQSLQYTNKKLGDLTLDQGQESFKKHVDPENQESRHKQQIKSWGWELNPYITALQAVA